VAPASAAVQPEGSLPEKERGSVQEQQIGSREEVGEGWFRCQRGSATPPTSSSTPSPSHGRF